MQLSESQKQRILELRSKLFELLTCLLEKRRIILQHLEVCLSFQSFMWWCAAQDPA